MSSTDRFMSKVEPVPFAGCWLWTGVALKVQLALAREYGVTPQTVNVIVLRKRWKKEEL